MAQRIGIVPDLHLKYLNPSTRKDNYFEAGIAKLEFILQNCNIIIQLGDFFDKSKTEDIVKNRVLALFNRYRKPVYIVPGNHDIENNQIETLPNTSLMNLAYHGMVTVLTPDRVWDIGGLKIGVLDYYIDAAKKQSFEEEVDIVIGHHFYDWFRDPSKGLEPQDIAKYNANYLFLGHDHEPHENLEIDGTTIIRAGSVMRTELNSNTPKHIPSFHIIDAKDNGIFTEPKRVEIPCTPWTDAFFYKEKQSFKKCTKLVSDIKTFLEQIELQPESKRTVGQILKEDLKAPKEVYEHLELIYRLNHLVF